MPAICQIQAHCYESQYLEQPAAFSSKISKTAETCWLAYIDDQPIAYLICLPVSTSTFPALNASDFELCDRPSLLYLHDLAVDPKYRTVGAGQQLIKQVVDYGKQEQYQQIGLIAVQDAASYWQKQGFNISCAKSFGLENKLISFGADAVFMRKQI